MRLLDKRPMHHDFGIADAQLVSPGKPEHSGLVHRIATRDRGQMPQLATEVVDERAVELIRRWIAGLPPEPTMRESAP